MKASKGSGRTKSLIFDLMGTCLDWHSSIAAALGEAMDQVALKEAFEPPNSEDNSRLALEWRQGFFDEIHARFEAGEGPEDIDETHRRVLLRLLDQPKWAQFARMSDQSREECVRAWHSQSAWPDVGEALDNLREFCDVIVLANGTTRLQLDLAASSGLTFDLLLSSELLGLTKPDPVIYKKAASLLRRDVKDCIMVAAHAYDVRAAKRVGMGTAYLQRWSEDLHEDMELVKAENDFFIDCRGSNSSGLGELHKMLANEGG